MTNQRAVILLSQMYLPAFDEEEKEAITKAIEALTEQNTVMTPAEFFEALKEIDEATKRPGRQYDDYELFHISADDLMCEILRGLGYGDGVDFFEAHEKWYA